MPDSGMLEALPNGCGFVARWSRLRQPMQP